MSDYRFSRRALLAGLGAGAGMLPLLHARKVLGQSVTFPRRLIVITWPNGVVRNRFWPTGGETDFVIDPADDSPLAPLIPHRRDILIVGGLELRALLDDRAPGGHAAYPYLLTGAPARPISAPINPDGYRKSAGVASVDQVVADEIARRSPRRFHSLQVNALRSNSEGRYISFRGAPIDGRPNAPTPEDDPSRLFATLFGRGAAEDPALRRARAEGRSVLDYVGRSLERMRRTLGAEDRDKVASHLEAVRDVERRLAGAAAACAPPAAPRAGVDYISEVANPNVPDLLRLQTDMVVAAMACDLTRVATLCWSNCHNNNYVFYWLGREFIEGRDANNAGFGGPYRHHHEIAHNAYASAAHTRRKNLVDRWFFSQFAYMIERLKSVPEGSGTMLDNTVVLFANSFAEGASHSVSDLPWVLAGGCGGYFRTGRMIRWAGGTRGRNVPHNGLLVALANAMGLERTWFGDARYGGEISGLRG